VTRIVADPSSDAVWLVSHLGADRFESGAWTYHPVGAPAGDRCNDVAFAPNGDVWFARRQGATRLSSGTVTDFDSASGLAEDACNAVAVDASGQVWVGHQDQGLSLFDGALWRQVDSADGLTHDRVKAVEVAPNGVLWFGTGINLGRFSPRHAR
jgi:ligand-binding sensor domain-containing protein